MEWISLIRDEHRALDVRGFGTICQLTVPAFRSASPAECNDARIMIEGGQLKFWTLSAPSPQIIPIAGREGPYPAGEQRVPDSELTVDFTHGNRSFRIIFQRVNRHREAQGMTVIYAPLFLLER